MPETCSEIDHYKVATERSPGEANSIWAVWVVLSLGAVAFAVMWHVARAPVHVTPPKVSVAESGEVIVTSRATNRTAAPVRFTALFILGYGRSRRNPSFVKADHRDVLIELDPQSSKTVHTSFPAPKGTGVLVAQVQIIRRD